MNKIKLLAALIFVLSLVLAYYSKYISSQNEINLRLLKTINEQKAFTQEISKNIFYIYRNRDASTAQLDESIKRFVENMNHKEDILEDILSPDIQKQTDIIIKEWNRFYLLVQQFRDASRVENNAYTNILLEKLVKDIYTENLRLVVAFDKLIEMHKKYFDNFMYSSKFIQIFLFLLLIIVLIYFFTQLKDVIVFIQNFLNTSRNIVRKSTVKEVVPIETKSSMEDISKATDNFNYLVKKIDDSIAHSTLSIENASSSLETIERHIEDLLELVSTMDTENSYDKEIIKKEDILIEALEELSSSLHKLNKFKQNLQNFKK